VGVGDLTAGEGDLAAAAEARALLILEEAVGCMKLGTDLEPLGVSEVVEEAREEVESWCERSV
jgi:hypothetical protein